MTDHRARGLSVIRSRTGAPAETAAEAAARRAREYDAIMNPSAEQIAEAAAAIVHAAAVARGEVEAGYFHPAPPQPERRKLTPAEATVLAAQITAAAKKARGET
jgi:hypothetical protein